MLDEAIEQELETLRALCMQMATKLDDLAEAGDSGKAFELRLAMGQALSLADHLEGLAYPARRSYRPADLGA